MVPLRARPAFFLALAGCNAVSGVGDLQFDAQSSSSGGGAASATSASSGAGASGGGGSSSASSATSTVSGVGAGGIGGAPPARCGTGTIDPGEECDSGAMAQVGCDASCKVVCDGPHDFVDDTSHHCYYLDEVDTPLAWADARTFCQSTWGGGDLLALETMAEYQALLPHLPIPPTTPIYFWTGGSDQAVQGQYVWLDGSPITYPVMMPPWLPTEPNGNGDCIVWRADSAPEYVGLGDLVCTTGYHPFCERPPPGS